jgi:hypothetical protein
MDFIYLKHYKSSPQAVGINNILNVMPEKSKSNHVLDFGLSFHALNNLSFDASAGVGLTDNSPDFFVNGGFSFRLPE